MCKNTPFPHDENLSFTSYTLRRAAADAERRSARGLGAAITSRECNAAGRLLPDCLLKPELHLLVLDQRSDDKPCAHKAEEVSEEHEYGQRPVQWRALLRQQQKVNVDGQLREQCEKPVANELWHLLLHVADKPRLQAQRLADAPQHEQHRVEDTEPEGETGATKCYTFEMREATQWRGGRGVAHTKE